MPQENDTVVETTNAKPQEDWMARRWRPAMGWLYMAVCAMDFMIFPVLWSVLQSVSHGQVTNQWQPLTLQGAGLFHLAMGAVLGIAAYGRTQEKMAGANNGGLNAGFNGGSTAGTPVAGFSNTPSAFGSAPAPAFVDPAPTITTAPPPAFGGKPMGPAQSFPAL